MNPAYVSLMLKDRSVRPFYPAAPVFQAHFPRAAPRDVFQKIRPLVKEN